MAGVRFLAALALLWLAGASNVSATDCTPEPASQWAPAGFICPPEYGIGTASTYGGPGVARNDCTYPFHCAPISVRSLDTGRTITVVPVTWCMCWVGVTGPNGETARIIDLDPSQVRALGLDPSRGLWQVEVEPSELPDTAMTPEIQGYIAVYALAVILLFSLVLAVNRRR